MELLVAAFERPDIQGKGGDFVDIGDGLEFLGKIYVMQIAPTSVANLSLQVRHLFGGVVGELLLVAFATGGTLAPREGPFAEAERADKCQGRAVRLGT